MSDKKRIEPISSKRNLSQSEEKKNDKKIAYFQSLSKQNQFQNNREYLVNSAFLTQGNASLKKLNPKNLEITVLI